MLVGVYLWSRGVFNRRILPALPRRAARTEPNIDGEQPSPAVVEPEPLVEAVPAESRSRLAPDRIVALRLIPRDDELAAERAVEALRNAGLEYGRYSIFHRSLDDNREAFSVASLTEPGSFELDKLADTTIAGLSFFVALP
ncbi:MAG TPA: cell division protein ZipA C-terminal FtsZ-binding domain-containing protein, partial [Vicinamibacterales bacterium]|nr:cell division protein ZipA C-terminal FtsZ-binding domain-containing protein [Vicinamibacterales bacterium]